MNQPLGDPLDLPTDQTSEAQDNHPPQSTEKPVDEGPPPVCGDVDEMTILVVGTDFRGSNYLYGLADVIRIVHIDFTIPQVNIVALPRAILIKDPGPNLEVDAPVLLNQTYLFGTQGMGHFSGTGYGAGALAEALQTNFGVSVDNYLVINFSAFQNFIDSIGGITVTLPQSVDAEPAATFPAGTQWLTGEKALILARNRKNSSDNIRIDYQSLIIQGILERLSDPTVYANLPDVIDAFSNVVLTDVTPAQIQSGLCMISEVDPATFQYFNPGDDLITYGRNYIPTVSKEMDVFFWNQDLVEWIQESLISIPQEQ
ncbi:LCP family protein [Chloroflexota bacterium]|nr:LCP family protein [Chloroflexota bacterium]